MAMDEDFLREVAAQLRKPNGKFGKEVAEKMNASNQQMNLKTIELLDILENDSVLEIGMGNGAFVPDILNSAKDVRYFGIDYSEDMVELANTMNNSFIVDHTVKFILSDVENLPFSSKTMDKIFTVNTIYFWKDLEAAFRECSRVLKEDGLFAITIRPKGCLKNILQHSSILTISILWIFKIFLSIMVLRYIKQSTNVSLKQKYLKT